VSVLGADVVGLMSAQALKTSPDISLDILHQMPQVNRAVSVGQGAGYENSSRLRRHLSENPVIGLRQCFGIGSGFGGLQEPLEVGTIEVYPKGVIVETGLW